MVKKMIMVMALFLVIGLCFYQLFWGRLFPWSPMKFDYLQLNTLKATIILPNNFSLPEKLQNIDNLFTEVEQFHQLKFNKRVTIILPKTINQFTGFTGQKSAVACSLQTGTVIYLSPKIFDEKRDIAAILKHELSHVILYQHTSFFKSYKIPRWLNEGVAIYSGNPRDYYEGMEFTELVVNQGYFFDILSPGQTVKKIPQEYRNKFIYAEYRSFIAFLVEKYGIGKLQNYLKSVIVHPELERAIFKRIYRIELPEMLISFREEVFRK